MALLAGAGALVDMVLGTVRPVLDKFFDKTEQARIEADIRAQAELHASTLLTALLQAQRDAVLAELQNESWIARNWRALLMLGLSFVVLNNYSLAPYVQMLFGVSVSVELPTELWVLLIIGVAGYLMNAETFKMIVDLFRRPRTLS